MARLSSAAQKLIITCAQIMSQRQDNRSLNLFSLNTQFRELEGTILALLATKVEELSGGRLTVRRADSALFKHHGSGMSLNVAVCPALAPKDTIITQGSPEITLYHVAPYAGGFGRDPGASLEEVAKYRAFVAKSARQRVRQSEIQARVMESMSGFWPPSTPPFSRWPRIPQTLRCAGILSSVPAMA